MENKKKLTKDELIKTLYDVDYLNDLLRSHKQEYEGILLHVLFGEITRYLVKEVKESINYHKTSNKLEYISNLVEKMLLEGDEEVYNIAYVSFIENLLNINKDIQKIIIQKLQPTSKKLMATLI